MSSVLHLMFDHSNYSHDLNSILFNEKAEIASMKRQVDARYRAAIKSQGNLELDEALNIIEILTNDPGGKKKQVFETHSQGQMPAPNFSAYSGLSEEQLMAVIQGDGSKILTGLSSFQEILGNALDKAWQDLGQKGWRSIQQDILNQYIAAYESKYQTAAPTGNELKNQIIQDFVTHSGLINLMGSENSPYKTSLRNLTLLAIAIPEFNLGTGIQYSYGSSNGVMQTASTYGQFFEVIKNKVNGNWKNIVGGSGEIAAAAAELAGSYKAKSTIANMHQNLRNIGIKVRETGTNQVSRINSLGKEYFVQQKGDITVRATADNVEISYGISVKNYTVPTDKPGYSKVSLGGRTDFMYLAQKAGFNEGLVAHVAAGHGSDDELIPSSIRENTKTTSSMLNSKWDTLKQVVIYRSFMSILAGESMRAGGDNVLVLNIKGSSFTLKDIVNHLEHKNMEIHRAIQGTSRATLVSLNPYQSNLHGNDSWFQRIEAYDNVVNTLRNAKVNIDLHFLASMI